MSRKHKKNRNYYNQFPRKETPKNEDFGLSFWKNLLLFLSIIIYALLFPPFFKNQTLAGHDAGAHLAYLRIFTDALSQGQFPVRWIEWVAPGQNQPLFSYYQPLLYYLGQIPHFLGLDILNSLYAVVLFMWLFSGFITYLFVKNVTKNSLSGAIASAIYVFAPYHILDVFVRAAYPESIALAFAPGIFWALERFFSSGKRKYMFFIALFTSATFVSHPPTFLMFSIPIFFYILFLSFEKLKEETFKSVIRKIAFVSFSFILGGGISAFFALPALFQQSLTKASSLAAGYLDFHNHFVCLIQLFWSDWGYGTSQAGCSDKISFQVGIVNWIVIVSIIGILAFYLYKKMSHRANRSAVFWLAVTFFGMYMTLSFSQPFWEGTPYLSFLQFPWRFLSVTIFSVSVLSGVLLIYIKNEKMRIVLFLIFIILTPLLSFTFLNPPTYLPKDYFAQDSKDFYKGTVESQAKGTAQLGYMPKTMDVLPEKDKVPLSEIGVTNPDSQVKVISSNMTTKDFKVISQKPMEVELFIHYFPGWKFYLNGNEIKANTSNIYDFVFIKVPSGENRITAKFTNTPFINASNYLSLISFVVLIIFSFLPANLKPFKAKEDTT